MKGILESLLEDLQQAVDNEDIEVIRKKLPFLITKAAVIEQERDYLIAKAICRNTPCNECKKPGTEPIEFLVWQKGIEEHYKREILTTKHERDELRKTLFKTRMDLFMKSHPEFADIPFAYCDVNRQLLCTPAVYELFAIEQGKELDLRDLLSHVDRKDAEYIFGSLKQGTRLKDYQLKDVRSIRVFTYPLFYSELPVGVAMVLQTPEIVLETGKLSRFVKSILREAKALSSEYHIVKQKAKSPEKAEINPV